MRLAMGLAAPGIRVVTGSGICCIASPARIWLISRDCTQEIAQWCVTDKREHIPLCSGEVCECLPVS
jgi:hypothetical protein